MLKYCVVLPISVNVSEVFFENSLRPIKAGGGMVILGSDVKSMNNPAVVCFNINYTGSTSKSLLKFAQNHCLRLNIPLVILYVDEVGGEHSGSGLVDSLIDPRKDYQERARILEKSFSGDLKSLGVRSLFLRGPFQECLKAACEDLEPSLVIMGWSRRSLVRDILGKSKLAQIVRDITYPILLLGSSYRACGHNERIRIVMADSGRRYPVALECGKSVSEAAGNVDIFHLHVSDPSQEARLPSLVEHLADRFGLSMLGSDRFEYKPLILFKPSQAELLSELAVIKPHLMVWGRGKMKASEIFKLFRLSRDFPVLLSRSL